MECPKCGARSWSARCEGCGFQLLPDAPPTSSLQLAAPAAPAPRPPRAVAQPWRQRPLSTVGPLELSRGWDRRAGAFALLFAIALAIAGLRGHAALPLRVVLAVAGLCLAYVSVAALVNSTTVAVAAGWLTVSHGPLPLKPGRRVPLGSVTQIFVRTTFHSRRKHPSLGHWSPREDYLLYHVVADLADGGELPLLGSIDDVSHARRLERLLEDHLGIVDDPMRSLSERRA